MVRSVSRLMAGFRLLRRQDIMGAIIAIVFVVGLMSFGLYAIATQHGFYLAGG